MPGKMAGALKPLTENVTAKIADWPGVTMRLVLQRRWNPAH